MKCHTTFKILALALILAASTQAQVAWVDDGLTPGAVFDTYLPSAAYPVGAPSPIGPFPNPAAGALLPATFPGGGVAIDEFGPFIYTTDGFGITMDLHAQYLPFTPVLPPPPGPFPAPALLTGGPITGMAFDAATGTLWMCDPGSYGPFTPVPPFLPLGPAIPFAPPTGAALTGIDIEAATGSLWLCDAGGAVFNLTPGGLPIGPQPVVVVPSVTGGPFMAGICVNDSNGPGSFPPPFCSPQLPGFHICLTDGVMVYDALPGGLGPIPLPGAVALMPAARGMAYSNDFQITFGSVGCGSTGVIPLPGTAMPNFNGPGAFTALRLTGAPPATSVFCLADLCPLPGGALLASGESLWINPLSATYSLLPALTDAAGDAALPVSYVPVPPGIQFSFQWAIPDSSKPLGFCLTDLVTLTIGAP